MSSPIRPVPIDSASGRTRSSVVAQAVAGDDGRNAILREPGRGFEVLAGSLDDLWITPAFEADLPSLTTPDPSRAYRGDWIREGAVVDAEFDVLVLNWVGELPPAGSSKRVTIRVIKRPLAVVPVRASEPEAGAGRFVDWTINGRVLVNPAPGIRRIYDDDNPAPLHPVSGLPFDTNESSAITHRTGWGTTRKPVSVGSARISDVHRRLQFWAVAEEAFSVQVNAIQKIGLAAATHHLLYVFDSVARTPLTGSLSNETSPHVVTLEGRAVGTDDARAGSPARGIWVPPLLSLELHSATSQTVFFGITFIGS